MRKLKQLIDWFVRGKNGRVYLIQIPNVLLAGWLLLRVIVQFTPAGSTRAGLMHLSQTLLAIWSYLEITEGASRFRRVLGAVVAIVIVYGFLRN